MLTFPVPAAINGDALTKQLADAGFPGAAVSVAGDELQIVGPQDGDRAAVEAVVSAHDGQPLPLSPERQADEDARAQLAAIRSKAKEVAAGTGTFTAAQIQKILAHLILRATR